MLVQKRLALLGIVSAGLVFAASISLIAAGNIYRGDLRAALPGSPAPEIASRDVDNQLVQLSGLRGSFVLLYFSSDIADSATAPDGSTDHAVSVAERLAATSADLEHLTHLCSALSAQEVTVLESRDLRREQPMDLISLVAQGGSPRDSETHGNRMLLDRDGNIARRFKVDCIAAKPTLFVIDANGIIRFRGSCEQAAASKLLQDLNAAAADKQVSLGSTSFSHIPAMAELTPAINLD